MKLFTIICLTMPLFGFATGARASSLFENSEVLEVTLTGPVSSLLANKTEKTEQPFVWRADGVEHEVKVRVRGKSRLRVCKFAPLRINFNRRDTKNTQFEGQDKLKLVTQCKPGQRSQIDLLEEYAAYRILNALTDLSYRVRLLRMSYVDSDGGLGPDLSSQYGFLLESADGFQQRHAATPVQTKALTLSSLNQEHAALVFVFQYLIANTDWSLVTADLDSECCHNGDLFDIDGKLHYVPYDFDLAGLVNTRYAKPDSSIGIKRVTNRRYRGYCIPTEPVKRAVEHVGLKQDHVLDVFESLPGLSAKQIQSNKKFLQPVFKQIGNPGKLLKRFERRCL